MATNSCDPTLTATLADTSDEATTPTSANQQMETNQKTVSGLERVPPKNREQIYQYLFNTYRPLNWSSFSGVNRALLQEVAGEHHGHISKKIREIENFRVLVSSDASGETHLTEYIHSGGAELAPTDLPDHDHIIKEERCALFRIDDDENPEPVLPPAHATFSITCAVPADPNMAKKNTVASLHCTIAPQPGTTTHQPLAWSALSTLFTWPHWHLTVLHLLHPLINLGARHDHLPARGARAARPAQSF